MVNINHQKYFLEICAEVSSAVPSHQIAMSCVKMVKSNHMPYMNKCQSKYHSIHNDAKRRVYVKNLAKKQKCPLPCSVLFSSRYIDEKKSFVKDLFPVPANLHI